MRSNIDHIVNIMEMMDPTQSVGMGDKQSRIYEIQQMDVIPNQRQYGDSNDSGFHANDYILAKQLLAQVGSVDRAMELLSNLEQVIDTLDIKDDYVDHIAQCCDEI